MDVFKYLSDEIVERLILIYKEAGYSDDDAFSEVYSIDCNMDELMEKEVLC